MQLKLFVINLLTGVMIVSLILFSQVFRALAGASSSSSSDQTDKELKDKDIKHKSKSSYTKPNDEDNVGNHKAVKEKKQQSNDHTRGRGLQADKIMINDNDIPFELPFHDIIPFP
jgi:hypothetical protein